MHRDTTGASSRDTSSSSTSGNVSGATPATPNDSSRRGTGMSGTNANTGVTGSANGGTSDAAGAPGQNATTDTTNRGASSDTSVNRSTTPSDTSSMKRDTSAASSSTGTTTPSDTSAARSDTSTAAPSSTSGDTTMTSSSMYGGRMFHNGLYIGVAGGATFPTGDFKNGYNTGWNVDVPIGWQSTSTPWGLRLDATYNQLGGKSVSDGFNTFTLSNAKVWSGLLDLTFRLPMGEQGTSAFYLLGGGGVHHFTDLGGSTFSSGSGSTVVSNATTSTTKLGLNGGAGYEFPVGNVAMFVEGRYVSVFTDNGHTNYIPVSVGFKFF